MNTELQLMQRVSDLEKRVETLIAEKNSIIRYLLYFRLPLGDKVVDHLPQEWEQICMEALKPTPKL